MNSIDPKNLVAEGYNRCARAYSDARRHRSDSQIRWVDVLGQRLPSSSKILDVGCGSGFPITATLATFAAVTGVDISKSQLELARQNVPSAHFICGDIMAQTFPDASFDAIVAYYSLFHVPRDEQVVLLSRFKRWLRPDGYLLATLANSDHPGYTEPDFFGTTMYWSHFDSHGYYTLLERLGFDVLLRDVTGHGYDDASEIPAEQHPIVLAQTRS